MRLEIAELMIAIKEEFKVDIDETEAQRIETVGGLVGVSEKLIAKSPVDETGVEDFRINGIAQVKKYLSTVRGVDESTLTEETVLEEFFQIETRSELWFAMRETLFKKVLSLQSNYTHAQLKTQAEVFLKPCRV